MRRDLPLSAARPALNELHLHPQSADVPDIDLITTYSQSVPNGWPAGSNPHEARSRHVVLLPLKVPKRRSRNLRGPAGIPRMALPPTRLLARLTVQIRALSVSRPAGISACPGLAYV